MTRLRVLLATVGTRGDVEPFVALALALRDAGHDVALCTCPRFADVAGRWDLPLFALDEGLLELLDGPVGRALIGQLNSMWSALRSVPGVLARIRPIHERMIADLWRATGTWQPDVTVFHQKLFCIPAFASLRGSTALAAALVPMTVPTGEAPFWGMPQLPLGPAYNRATYRLLRALTTLGTNGYTARWRAAHDAAGRSRGSSPYRFASGEAVPVLHAYSTVVCGRPADWPDSAQVTGYWRMPRGSGATVPGELQAFVEQGPPPVYIGFGSMVGLDPAHTTAVVLDAVAQSGVRAVLGTGWGGLQPEAVPDTVCVAGNVDHAWLFPRMAAIVHHGGAGTTAAALHAGVPSVICPFGVDQPFWGRRLMELGAGPPPIPQRTLRAESLANAITRCTSDPGFRTAAAHLAHQLNAENGTRNAVHAIETIARQG